MSRHRQAHRSLGSDKLKTTLVDRLRAHGMEEKNKAVTLSKMCHGNCENERSTVTEQILMF